MDRIVRIISLLRKQTPAYVEPIVTRVARQSDPFLVLISCILSLRTKDATTAEAGKRLFRVARTPQQMLSIPLARLSRTIYPVGFYRTKAKNIHAICRRLIDDFNAKVPDSREELLSLHGVGRKTANLVLGLGFGIPAVCVDTHVHRISNRLGWVKTAVPEETEHALEKLLSRKYWIEINTLLVAFGQNICLPVSPWCSRCSIRAYCPRAGVGRSR
ncbi:MAG: endonuclease III [Candidatus Omnitrophica bacterium]|nr:endonuclease III [Candidatus Omnitrophota bacterium]